MEQLLKVTRIPFQAIHFTQSARLVPTDNIDVERRKAMARHSAFRMSHLHEAGSVDLEYINKINSAFSSGRSSSGATGNAVPVYPQKAAPQAGSGVHPQPAAAAPREIADMAVSYQSQPSYADRASSISAETQASYMLQRGSLEFRVAKGDLAFIPPLAMTIITQYPEIHFEYVGGYNYVPPRNEFSGGTMNLSI